MELSVIGIDLAKNVFQLHGVGPHGQALLRKRFKRKELLPFIATLTRCTVAMEACAGASFWARQIRALGFEVRLIAPQFVKPFVKSNKNDAADAEAICEAAQRQNMRFVAPKSIQQQDIQCLHRIRSRVVAARTALSNEIRGLLGEYGAILPKGLSRIRKELVPLIEQARLNGWITEDTHRMFLELLEELKCMDERIAAYDEKIQAIHRNHPICQKISKIPGIGPITATALVAATGDPASFKNGRQFSAWIGLVPRQHSSGGKERLLGISKRGDVYLRTLLIHGARCVVRLAQTQNNGTNQEVWLKRLIERKGCNRTAVALANKNARRVWALMTSDEEYRDVA